MRLIDGFVTTQLLYVASKLGIADVLADGPKRGEEIADAVGADRDTLLRVLKGLVTDDVLAEEDDGRFALTPVGVFLKSMQGAALVRGEVYYGAALLFFRNELLMGGNNGFTDFKTIVGADTDGSLTMRVAGPDTMELCYTHSGLGPSQSIVASCGARQAAART